MTVLNEADAIYLGGQAVDAVYAGADKVWPAVPPPGYNDIILARSPRLFLPLDDTSGTTANDLTGNYPGTYQSGYTLGGGNNADGSPAVSLDGTTGASIVIPGFTVMPIPCSVELWTNLVAGASGNFYALVTKSVSNVGSPIDWRHATGLAWIAVSPSWVNGVRGRVAGVWNHHALVVNGSAWGAPGSMTYYLNGAVDVNSPSPFTLYADNSAAALRIGNRGDGATPFRGPMSRVAVYDYALSSQEVAESWAAGQ